MTQLVEAASRQSKITVPALDRGVHPLARLVFALMRIQNVTYDEMEYRSGVLRSTIKAWRTHNRPGLESIEATLGVLGWAVLPVPGASQISPALRADLEAIAEKHGLMECPVVELIATCMGNGWRALLQDRSRRRTQQIEKRIAA